MAAGDALLPPERAGLECGSVKPEGSSVRGYDEPAYTGDHCLSLLGPRRLDVGRMWLPRGEI